MTALPPQLRLRDLRNALRQINADRASQGMPILPEVEQMYLRIGFGTHENPEPLIAEAEAVLERVRG